MNFNTLNERFEEIISKHIGEPFFLCVESVVNTVKIYQEDMLSLRKDSKSNVVLRKIFATDDGSNVSYITLGLDEKLEIDEIGNTIVIFNKDDKDNPRLKIMFTALGNSNTKSSVDSRLEKIEREIKVIQDILAQMREKTSTPIFPSYPIHPYPWWNEEKRYPNPTKPDIVWTHNNTNV